MVTKTLAYDTVIEAIGDYVCAAPSFSNEAYATARLCLMDTLGCGLLALQYPACTKLLGPVVPGAELAGGCRVPGNTWELDPVRAAFNIGTMIRWLDYNDTWLAAEWGHPSDNLGAILAVADYMCRKEQAKITVHDMLTAMIQAHEIQGVLALNNSFNRVGIDHVLLVKIASTAVVTAMLGGTKDQVLAAVSNAWADGGTLRCYRHYPNTGSRKSWAAGDAASRAVTHALQCLRGEMGYPTVLYCPTWGFQDAFFKGQEITLERPLRDYVMEHVLFKVSYPAEFHAQTAVEAAAALHQDLGDRIDDIARIDIDTHESALRIIDKTGPLNNPADRDHCLQYMVAVALLKGDLTADDYEDSVAQDPRIDTLREKMHLRENAQFSQDYLDPDKRSIANTITVTFSDASKTETVSVEYPLGHRRRRAEARPVLIEKFRSNAGMKLSQDRIEALLNVFNSSDDLDSMPADSFMNLLV